MIKFVVIALFPFLFATEYEVTEEIKPVLSIEKRIYNRFTLNQSLIKLFGESSKKHIYQGIFSKPQIFSGPCDVYEQIRTSDTGVLDPYTSCFERNDNSVLPLFGSSNILRSGYIVKTCLNITGDKEIVQQFMKRTGNDVKRIYKEFYPFKTPNDEVLSSLSNVLKKHGERWLVHTLCIDPGWKTI